MAKKMRDGKGGWATAQSGLRHVREHWPPGTEGNNDGRGLHQWPPPSWQDPAGIRTKDNRARLARVVLNKKHTHTRKRISSQVAATLGCTDTNAILIIYVLMWPFHRLWPLLSAPLDYSLSVKSRSSPCMGLSTCGSKRMAGRQKTAKGSAVHKRPAAFHRLLHHQLIKAVKNGRAKPFQAFFHRWGRLMTESPRCKCPPFNTGI